MNISIPIKTEANPHGADDLERGSHIAILSCVNVYVDKLTGKFLGRAIRWHNRTTDAVNYHVIPAGAARGFDVQDDWTTVVKALVLKALS